MRGLTGARSLLLSCLALAAAFGLALPMRRLTRGRATAVAESAYPEFQQRLLTFDDREKRGNDPFLELLAADTLAVAKDLPPANLAPRTASIFWRVRGSRAWPYLAGLLPRAPVTSAMRASPLWTGPKAVPLYDIRVTPGDVAVRRNSDQLVTAQVIGLKPERCNCLPTTRARAIKPGSRSQCSRKAMLRGSWKLQLSVPLRRPP